MRWLARPGKKPHNIGAMRIRFLLLAGWLVTVPLWGARLETLEITVLPRSEGRILVDIRGEVREVTPSRPLTLLHLEGVRRPVIKFFAPDEWKWTSGVDAVRLVTSIPSGSRSFTAQIEGYPTGALRILSDLPASGIRLFLPEGWDFPAQPVDHVDFRGRKLAVYALSGGFPLVIPLGKGKPQVFLMIAGVIFLLALIAGSVLFWRRRHPAPSLEDIPEEAPPAEEMLEETQEVAPEPELEGEPVRDVIAPKAAPPPSQEPSLLTDPLAQLGVVGEPSEETGVESEPSPAGEEPLPEGEADLLHLGMEVGIPAEEPEDVAGLTGMEESPPSLEPEPESDSLLGEKGPVSIEEQLLGERGEARSIEEDLLGEARLPAPEADLALSSSPPEPSEPEPVHVPEPELEPEPRPELPPDVPSEPEEEPSLPPSEVSETSLLEPETDESSSFLFQRAGTPEEKVEASPLDMLDMKDIPAQEEETPHAPPEPEPEMLEDEEDLYVELDEALLPQDDLEVSAPSPPEQYRKPPEPGRTSPMISAPEQESKPSEPAEPPRGSPPPERVVEVPEEKTSEPPSPSVKPPQSSRPSEKPERKPGPAPSAGSPEKPSDREELIRQWLLKRKKRKKS